MEGLLTEVQLEDLAGDRTLSACQYSFEAAGKQEFEP